jgi:hypothetical protein
MDSGFDYAILDSMSYPFPATAATLADPSIILPLQHAPEHLLVQRYAVGHVETALCLAS